MIIKLGGRHRLDSIRGLSGEVDVLRVGGMEGGVGYAGGNRRRREIRESVKNKDLFNV